MLRVVVDSTADVPPVLRASGALTVVPVLLHRGDETLRDDVDISRDAFYAWLTQADALPRTAAPTVGMFADALRVAAADGASVLVITVSQALSATYGAACQAAALLPAAHIAVLDSRSIALPITYLALEALRLADAGETLPDIVAQLERRRSQTMALVALDTLHYLERGGRIGRVAALLGGLLDIKPVLAVADGTLRAVDRPRTRRRALERLVELAAAQAPFSRLDVMYTTEPDVADRLADACAAAGLLPRARIGLVQIGAVLGAHAGPGALAITALRSPT
jgi:DegV family protein with EDD domain